jgi:hypothetical protein
MTGVTWRLHHTMIRGVLVAVLIASRAAATLIVDSVKGSDVSGCGTDISPCRSLRYTLNEVQSTGTTGTMVSMRAGSVPVAAS